jgi:hypothetical protein
VPSPDWIGGSEGGGGIRFGASSGVVRRRGVIGLGTRGCLRPLLLAAAMPAKIAASAVAVTASARVSFRKRWSPALRA